MKDLTTFPKPEALCRVWRTPQSQAFLNTRNPGREHRLYHLWDRDGDLLYIGITAMLKPSERITHHVRHKFWGHRIAIVNMQPLPGITDRRPAELIERDAIKARRPRYNQDHNDIALVWAGIHEQFATMPAKVPFN